MRTRIISPVLGLCLSYLSLSAPALLAQTKAGSSSKDVLTLEEVIVSAQRKSESLQDTPISIAAFDAEKLEMGGVSNLQDIDSSVPNMQVNPFPTNKSTLSVTIRGIGQADSQITQDSPVAVYLDGVYLARNVGLALDIADLQRIEILRGPQGTLYGRNATGGAISLVTKRPTTDEFEFKQKITVANRMKSSTTSANIPLSENLAIKLAYLVRDIDGFVENPRGRGDWGDTETRGARLDVRWMPSESFAVDYSYDDSKSGFYNYTYQALRPGTPTGGSADLVQDNGNNAIRQGPGYHEKRLDSLTSTAPLEESSNDAKGHALVLTWWGENTELKYIAARRELFNATYSDLASGGKDYRLDSNEYTAPDGEYFPLVIPELNQEQTSHEITWSGEFVDSRLELFGGLFYMEETATDKSLPEYHLTHGRLGSGGVVAPGVVLSVYDRRDTAIENEGWAAYMRVTYTPDILNDALHLTFGGRHSEDERSAFSDKGNRAVAYPDVPNGLSVAAPLSSGGYIASASSSYTDDSFEWVIAYDLSELTNIYLKYNEAYRTGGFNTRDPNRDGSDNEFGTGFVDGFAPEKVGSHEFGIKSELFGRRVRANANFFVSDYTDMQTSFLTGASIGDTKALNAGEASLDGFELDVTWLVTHGLIANVSYARLDAELEEVINPTTGEDQTARYEILSAPEQSYSASLDWTISDASWARTSLYISYNYIADRNGSGFVEAAPKDSTYEAYNIINARLNFSDISLGKAGSLTAAAWVKNVQDKEYVVHAVSALPHSDRAVMWGEPRSYGIDFIYNY